MIAFLHSQYVSKLPEEREPRKPTGRVTQLFIVIVWKYEHVAELAAEISFRRILFFIIELMLTRSLDSFELSAQTFLSQVRVIIKV